MGSARTGSNPVGVAFMELEFRAIRRSLGNAAGVLISLTAWPSGLRRQLKALVRKGVGSNPTAVIFGFERSCKA